MFLRQGNTRAVSILSSLYAQGGQSRAVLLLGPEGSGKFSAALDFASKILKSHPLSHPDFFCFRNDRYALKAQYFLTKMKESPLTHTFLELLHRRMSASLLLSESLTLPTGVKLPAIKEELERSLHQGLVPSDEKIIQGLIACAKAYDKKTGIPMDVIREAISFHSTHSEHGRISIFGGFDHAEENTQNSALKLLEEPHVNHWIVLTASDSRMIIPTILSRVITVNFAKPRSGDLVDLYGHRNTFHSSIEVMEEAVHGISALKNEYLKEFFTVVIPTTDKGASIFQFAEKLEKASHGELFLKELLNVLGDALLIRRGHINGVSLPLIFPSYQPYAQALAKGSSAELEDLAIMIEQAKAQVRRPVIRTDSVLPDIFINISRQYRIFSGRH
ncbi:MAG: hypothetical protein ACRCY4_08080 [Brevinema sp.]